MHCVPCTLSLQIFDIVAIVYFQLFINNEWVNCASGKTFETLNPSTGEKIADIQEADKVRG